MDYPKMVYASASKFVDQKELEAAVSSGSLRMLVVQSEDAEAAAVADGWTAELTDLIRKKPGRKPADAQEGA